MAESAALRRRLTTQLRRLRSKVGLTQQQVAESLYWSPSKVIRIEQGTVRITPTDLQALLTLYGVADPEVVAELVQMARNSRKLPFAEYREITSAEAVRYFQYEANASVIRQVTPILVPGLLQTEEYTRALLEAYGTPAGSMNKLVESRQERQELFERTEPLEARFVLDEAVLRRTVGGPRTMGRQIEHLVEMSRRADTSIQVLPFSVGAHSAMKGPFVHLEFPDDNDPDVIFIENTLGDTLLRDDEETTAQYLEQFLTLENIATPRDAFEKIARAGEI